MQGDLLCSLFAFPTPQVSLAAREPILGDAGSSFKCSRKPKGFFPTHSRPQQSLLCCWEVAPSSHMAHSNAVPQAELSCPGTALCPLWALVRSRPPGISMGPVWSVPVMLRNWAGLFCCNVLTGHFQLKTDHFY